MTENLTEQIEKANNFENFSEIEEQEFHDYSPRQFIKTLEVDLSRKVASKPILEVRKFLCGDFLSVLKQKNTTVIKPENINYAKKSQQSQ